MAGKVERIPQARSLTIRREAMKDKFRQHAEASHGFENVPANVPRPTTINPLPPMDAQQMFKHSILGQPVRALVGGHMSTVYLTDYDVESDSYHGLLVRCRSMASDVVPHFEAVRGLRLWQDNSTKDFQFVTPGSDESVLINLAQANAVRAQDGAGVQPDANQ
jgi:hypothetical protein